MKKAPSNVRPSKTAPFNFLPLKSRLPRDSRSPSRKMTLPSRLRMSVAIFECRLEVPGWWFVLKNEAAAS